jgi:hypothetical protein
MIGVEGDLEGGEDNNRGGSLKPRKVKKRRKGDRAEVGSLQNMIMTWESRKCMTAAVEDMKVGDPVKVSWAGLRNGGESRRLQFRSRQMV